jgi:phosphoenolpyruvate carboxykinase (ATP)
MNNIYDIRTPSEGQAGAVRSDYGLDNLGLANLRKAYWNLSTEALYEESIFRGEANIVHMGPLIVNTGKHTARAAGDKFVVRETTTEDRIWWGQYNRPFEAEKFDALFARLQGYFQGRDVFIQDCYGGADPEDCGGIPPTRAGVHDNFRPWIQGFLSN